MVEFSYTEDPMTLFMTGMVEKFFEDPHGQELYNAMEAAAVRMHEFAQTDPFNTHKIWSLPEAKDDIAKFAAEQGTDTPYLIRRVKVYHPLDRSRYFTVVNSMVVDSRTFKITEASNTVVWDTNAWSSSVASTFEDSGPGEEDAGTTAPPPPTTTAPAPTPEPPPATGGGGGY